MAERGVFYASEEDHYICPIGVMTMGFQIPADRQAEAESIVNTMCELEYITPEEARALPSVPKGHKGIVYGPLAQMPVDPAVALFFCRPAQPTLRAEPPGRIACTGRRVTALALPA